MRRRNLNRWTGIVAAAALAAGIAAAPSGATGIASSNVEYLSTVPLEAGAPTGARLLGDHLYVAGARSFSIYDVTDPVAPKLLSITPVGFQFANEDVDTNGDVLIMSADTQIRKLFVWDVGDKAKPVKLAELENMRDHNFACVLDCKWAYGSRGTIVDLREPANPRVAGSWGGGVTPGDGFDTTEVAPGIVLASTRILRLLDARENPASPKLLASATTPDNRLLHSSRWPNLAKDRFALVQEETFAETRCDETSGTFMTWDTRNWRKTKTFRLVDQYRTESGTYNDGRPAANVLGCTAMWFQEHPDFRDGGLVTAAWFEHGTRFLEVAGSGRITEVGHFLPLGGSTIASYWITDEIVYSIDVVRGIDILRFDAA